MKNFLLAGLGLFVSVMAYCQTPTISAKNTKDELSVKQSDITPSIYPNPASNEITIEFGHEFQKGILKLYSINGSEVFSQNVTSMDRVDISQLRDGFYFYELIRDGKVIHVGRLIKK